MDIVKKAQKWASAVWQSNVDGWQNRSQDHNYRQYLVRPAINKAIGRLDPVKNGLFLDLGCGDGREMAYISDCLIEQGCFGRFYGFDLQRSLIASAKKRADKKGAIEFAFDCGNLERLAGKHQLNYKVDRVFSTFLLQELSNAEDHFSLAMKVMKPYWGCGVFALLDPAFGQVMRDKGAVKVNEELGESKYWRWAGEYPIVEEEGRTFYVPYFHRTLDDYRRLIVENFGRFWYRQFAPNQRVLQKSREERLSPFYEHPGNIYYPEITSISSTLVFIVDQPRTMPQLF